MQGIARQCFSVTLHNRGMCTTFEVIQNADTCTNTGISSENSEIYNSVSIHLRSRHTDWHTTLNCAMISHITGTYQSTKLDVSRWKFPKYIKMADEEFDQTGFIDLLIGADFFYEMLRSHIRTSHGNYPVRQVRVLGWTLSRRNSTTTTLNDPECKFHLREDNSLEHTLKRSRELEPMDPYTMTTEHQVCKQRVVTHTTQQDDVRSVFRLPTKIDP